MPAGPISTAQSELVELVGQSQHARGLEVVEEMSLEQEKDGRRIDLEEAEASADIKLEMSATGDRSQKAIIGVAP